MGEMDQSTLRVPDVLPVDEDVVTLSDRDAGRDADVVLDLDGEVLRAELDDELFVRAGAAGSSR